jgi:hypothetical protein
MTDLRMRVEEERGLIKRLQLKLPGYKGYRRKEDLRIADSLLRNQLYKRLGHVEEDATKLRQRLAEDMELEKLNDIKGLISDIQVYRNRVRHATQEYSGISADFRVLEGELNQLYLYDLGLFDSADRLDDLLDKLGLDPGSDKFKKRVGLVREEVRKMNESFDMRMETISGLVVSR